MISWLGCLGSVDNVRREIGPQWYAVQVSDTTMITRAILARAEKKTLLIILINFLAADAAFIPINIKLVKRIFAVTAQNEMTGGAGFLWLC